MTLPEQGLGAIFQRLSETSALADAIENVALHPSLAPPSNLPLNMPFCGEIPLFIDGEGRWFYAQTPILRPEFIQLFERFLHREADGRYALVTRFEKCIITVADVPFLAVSCNQLKEGGMQYLTLETSLGHQVIVGPAHPLRVRHEEVTGEFKIYVTIRPGLEALFSRALIYDVLAFLEPQGAFMGIFSSGQFFPLAPQNLCDEV